MKKSPVKQLNVGATRNDVALKPYGFCCDIKDQDSKPRPKSETGPFFSSSDITGGGPDIKFRIKEADSDRPFGQRFGHRSGHRSGHQGGHRSDHQSGQRSDHRGGQRNDHRGGQRSGYRGNHRSDNRGNHRGGHRGNHRGSHRSDNRGNHRRGQRVDWRDQPRGQRNIYRGTRTYGNIDEPSDGERTICKRCRGPLQWYLEDEIAAARDTMISTRQERYNAEMEENVRIAKEKERRKRRKMKGRAVAG